MTPERAWRHFEYLQLARACQILACTLLQQETPFWIYLPRKNSGCLTSAEVSYGGRHADDSGLCCRNWSRSSTAPTSKKDSARKLAKGVGVGRSRGTGADRESIWRFSCRFCFVVKAQKLYNRQEINGFVGNAVIIYSFLFFFLFALQMYSEPSFKWENPVPCLKS